jgi:hypothetical protein
MTEAAASRLPTSANVSEIDNQSRNSTGVVTTPATQARHPGHAKVRYRG